MSDVPEHVRRNRVMWDAWARKFAAGGADAWARETPTWGIWSVPESLPAGPPTYVRALLLAARSAVSVELSPR
jgi:hypothetical protein